MGEEAQRGGGERAMGQGGGREHKGEEAKY